MSFIPRPKQRIEVQSLLGSGIQVNHQEAWETLSLNLQAGAGIVLTPSTTDTSIMISAAQAGDGLAAVRPEAGSGINVRTENHQAVLSSAIVAGDGIAIERSKSDSRMTIHNTYSLLADIGSGIGLVRDGNKTSIRNNLVAGEGIQIVPSSLNSSKRVVNSGVISLQVGKGLKLSGTPQHPVIELE